ncbi:MAG: lantibiotic dehydratase family protein [Acidobacteriia bacterium]|nr:lantibiotic dehydratase family protein [Terriglobia bacterium]
MWRLVALRGAGFPAAHVQRLRAPEGLRAAAEELLQLEEAAAQALEKALDSIRLALDDLRRNNLWDDRDRREPLLKALTRLKKGNMIGLAAGVLEMECVRTHIATNAQLEVARREFQRQYDLAVTYTSGVIAEFARMPRFREAVTWQNRQAVHSAFDPLINNTRNGHRRTSHQKQHEELVASYLQRYSVKNDTIGFFGPVGWANFVDQGEALVSKPGSDLLAARTVYFECWPIELLAVSILRDPLVFPWTAPFRAPFIHIEGLSVRHPVYGLLRITSQEAAIANACDGQILAREIAGRLVAEGKWFAGEMQVYNTMKDMATKGLLYCGFNIPPGVTPEKDLRAALERIEAPEVRAKAMSSLQRLEAARAEVASCAGDDRKLDAAIAGLEQTFVQLTNKQPTRRPGETYSARTMIYEDCRRDIEVSLGPELLRNLAPPLSLLLLSSRWMTAKCAEYYAEQFAIIHKELASELGTQSVGAAHLFVRARARIFGENDRQGAILQERLREKWQQVLGLDDAACQSSKFLRFSTEDLREKAREEFSCSRAGWNDARYQSPDVMIAASSVEAIQRGEYTLVLGELHAGANTLTTSLFVNQHPSPEDMIRIAEKDMYGPTVVPVIEKDQAGAIGRLSPALISPNDLCLEYARDSYCRDRAQALPIGSLVVENHGGEFIARSLDGRREVTIGELLGTYLARMVLTAFQMFPPRSHTPRIAIDNLIIKRESWRFKVEDIPLATYQEASKRFLEAQRWARMHGMPRFVFFKAPVEPKPCYLDIESPIYVELFAKILRRTIENGGPGVSVELSEMLPGPEQLWLSDAHGNRYASELRMVALDLVW